VRCHYRRSGGGWDSWGVQGWYDSEKRKSRCVEF
jgi:hypothetical protein